MQLYQSQIMSSEDSELTVRELAYARVVQ